MQQAASPSSGQRNNVADIYPLSPMQEGILFHTVSAPQDGLYMPQTAMRISGPVDDAALRAAWQSAVDRHPILRSSFHWEERDQPFQVVFKHIPIAFSVLDWSDTDEAGQRTRLDDLFASNRATPFDLRRPPLLRVQWIRTGPERFIQLVCYHHIILDGWSIRQLLDEVLTLYRRETDGTASVPPAARPYGDYIGWLKGRDREASIRFWRDYLEGSSGPTRLLNSNDTTRFERYRWTCPPALHQALKAFCATSGHTLNTLLQATLGLLIARQTGRQDVIFGATTSGRPATLAGATSMIGLFINTLPVRVVIDPEQPVQAWLNHLQSQHARTMDHDYVPLPEIQGRGVSLFDTLLVVENFGAEANGDRDTSLKTEGIDFDERTHFPLTLWVTPQAESLTLLVGYSRDTVEPSVIATMVQAFADVLTDMVASPSEPVGQILDCMAPACDAPGLASITEASPAAAARPPRAGTPHAATPTEQLLAKTWAEVLRCGPLDAQANFFELGGHSLLAARVISRLRGELSVNVPVRSLFERPVLADLAAYIDTLAPPAAAAQGHIEIEI